MDGASSLRVLSLFVCVAPQDRDWYWRLDKHLSLLKEQGWITSWSDELIQAGMERENTVARQRQDADLFLLLVSADFLASQQCQGTMEYALQREREGTAVVLPLLLRAVDWPRASFSQVLPKNHLPVSSWTNADEAFQEVVYKIQVVVEALRRWVVLACSPYHQSTLIRLASDLEMHHVAVSTYEEQAHLEEAIPLSSAVILLTSPRTCFSQMDRQVMDLAMIHRRPILVLWLPDEELPASVPQRWRGSLCIDARPSRYEQALGEVLLQLKCRLQALPPPSASEKDQEPRNPYKGLLPFGSQDADDFFGRETLIKDCLGALEQALLMDKQGQHPGRLLAVIGPSGLGKSSLVMAGVLPHLRRGILAASETWMYLGTLVPGTDPIEALTVALLEHFPGKGLKTIREDLQETSNRGLHQYATLLAQRQETAGVQVVLVVDQFEELFTQTVSEEKRRLFLDLLITAITIPHGPLIVILTLRADFYDHPMHYPQLYQLMQAHQVPVLPMDQSNLREVIEKPAQLEDVQITFEGDLVSDLLFEMRGQAGALPLLEFTLDQLFEHREQHLLTHKAYEEIGGIRGALTRHLEATYNGLPSEEHRALARLLFLRLVDPGKSDQDLISRRAALSEFSLTDPSQSQMLRETIDLFIDARLITADERASRTTIEISHEAIIHAWPRLQEWIQEAREAVGFQLSINRDIEEWERRGKPKERLYQGSQFKDARAWAEHYAVSEREQAFLRASVVQRTRRRTLFIVTSVIIMVVITSLSISALWQLLINPSPIDPIPPPADITTLADDGPGSLRQVLQDAKPVKRITFDKRLKGIIILKRGDLNITKDVAIVGPGTNTLAISGGTGGWKVHIHSNVTVTISDLAFKDTELGYDSAGRATAFLVNDGTLTMTRCLVSGNTVKAGLEVYGGGISNKGMLTLNDSTVSHNTIYGSGNVAGGGISNDIDATLTLNKSTVSYNSVSAGPGYPLTSSAGYEGARAGGGGILNFGILTLNESDVSYNSVTSQKSNIGNGGTDGNGFGGGITSAKSLILNGSTVSHNSVQASKEGNGGGIMNIGTATLRDSIVSDNKVSASAYGSGGGVRSTNKTTIINSIVSGNMVTVNRDRNGDRDSVSIGGGIYGEGELSLDGSTVTNNSAIAGGGITAGTFEENVTTTFTAHNTTISGNNATVGGGITFTRSKVNVVFCTIYGNSADNGAGLWAMDSGDYQVRDSVIVGNHATSQGHTILGTILFVRYDLVQDDLPSPSINTSNQQDSTLVFVDLSTPVGIDPTLRNNGGSTQTHALLPRSLALDKIPQAECQVDGITTDQRGITRPQGAACDIGAYEYKPA